MKKCLPRWEHQVNARAWVWMIKMMAGSCVLCVVTRFFIEAHRSSRILIDKQANECYYLMLANANRDCICLMYSYPKPFCVAQ